MIHFANGVWLALITWGVTIGPRSQRIATWACGALGVVLLLLAFAANFTFNKKDKYGVICLVKINEEKHIFKFWYPHE